MANLSWFQQLRVPLVVVLVEQTVQVRFGPRSFWSKHHSLKAMPYVRAFKLRRVDDWWQYAPRPPSNRDKGTISTYDRDLKSGREIFYM